MINHDGYKEEKIKIPRDENNYIEYWKSCIKHQNDFPELVFPVLGGGEVATSSKFRFGKPILSFFEIEHSKLCEFSKSQSSCASFQKTNEATPTGTFGLIPVANYLILARCYFGNSLKRKKLKLYNKDEQWVVCSNLVFYLASLRAMMNCRNEVIGHVGVFPELGELGNSSGECRSEGFSEFQYSI